MGAARLSLQLSPILKGLLHDLIKWPGPIKNPTTLFPPFTSWEDYRRPTTDERTSSHFRAPTASHSRSCLLRRPVTDAVATLPDAVAALSDAVTALPDAVGILHPRHCFFSLAVFSPSRRFSFSPSRRFSFSSLTQPLFFLPHAASVFSPCFIFP